MARNPAPRQALRRVHEGNDTVDEAYQVLAHDRLWPCQQRIEETLSDQDQLRVDGAVAHGEGVPGHQGPSDRYALVAA